MIVYLSGAMSGLEDFNRPAFNRMASMLTGFGVTVVNPASLPIGLSYKSYMSIAAAMVTASEAILVLPDSENSKGVKFERSLADALGLSEVTLIELIEEFNKS